MKKIITLIGLLGSLVFSQAAVATATVDAADSTNTVTSVLTEGGRITMITVANSGTNELTLAFFDAPSTSLTWTNAAWMWSSNYVGNYSVTNFTSAGLTNIYTYSNVLLATSITNAASTNNFVKVGTVSVPAGESLVIPYAAGLNVYRGLSVTNTTPGAHLTNHVGTITVTYGKQF